MALQCDVKKFGLTVKGAYLFVDYVNYDRRLLNPAFVNPVKDNAVIGLIIFTSKEARDNEEEPMEIRNFNFTIKVGSDAKNPVEQAYDYLKTLDEFQDAVGV
jgi:hypothetical protein|tara:strand:- start:567 stop:872 length:306 start_codon:yes stop_codon:yes gene_type:complete